MIPTNLVLVLLHIEQCRDGQLPGAGLEIACHRHCGQQQLHIPVQHAFNVNIKGEDVQQQQVRHQRLQCDRPGLLKAGDAECVQMKASFGKTLFLRADLDVLRFTVEYIICKVKEKKRDWMWHGKMAYAKAYRKVVRSPRRLAD